MGREYYEFSCGCRWPIVGPPPCEGALPLMEIDDENLPFCDATWNLLASGLTKGIFQLESNLGKHWTKAMRPTSPDHLGALGALLRPGCLKAKDDRGISMTEMYCLRKNGEEPLRSHHPIVDRILGTSYGVLAYQEQSMFLARELAGFSMTDADTLRKSIGKKDTQLMAECRRKFIDGARAAGVITEQQAEEVFGWIQESQRYGFNLAHAMSYGLLTYDSAYAKAHCPVAFFANWLHYAKLTQDPREETRELVEDARLFDVKIDVPDVRQLEPGVSIDGTTVRFGLMSAKGVGGAQVERLIQAVHEVGLKKEEWSWERYLLQVSHRVQSTFTKNVIQAGGFSWTGKSRKRLLNEYQAWSTLTDKEAEKARGIWRGEDIAELIRNVARPKKEGGGCANAKRVEALLSQVLLLRNPVSSEVDYPIEIARMEEAMFGVAVSCTRSESADAGAANCTCRDFFAGRTGLLAMAVEIRAVRQVLTKTGRNPGQKMAFLTVADATCSLEDVVIFTEAYKEYSHVLTVGNIVLLEGERDRKKNSFIVNRVTQL